MIGTFTLNKGELIKILVGQEGGINNAYPSCSGGGGSFVVTNDGTALIIAGGGAGTEQPTQRYSNADGSVSTYGNSGYAGSQWAGGRDGHGATVADSSYSGIKLNLTNSVPIPCSFRKWLIINSFINHAHFKFLSSSDKLIFLYAVKGRGLRRDH
jgi:hypothetical protein